jgi:hypothetical protein
MNKFFLTSLLVISMLALPTGTAFADGQALTLDRVYNTGRSIVFVFSVNGEFSKSELYGGSIITGDGTYGMSCNQVDADTVQCTADSRAIAGQDVFILFGNARFYTSVKYVEYTQKHAGGYCYTIYDWDAGIPWTYWEAYGTYCQDFPAKAGDQFVWDNPVYGPSTYTFYPDGVDDYGWANPGQGYYYYY